MKKLGFLILVCVSTRSSYGQSWDINIASGLGFDRLIPVNGSSRQTNHIRYGFFGPAIYLSPELYINVSPHSRFSFSYQYSANKTGLRIRAGRSGGSEEAFETFDLHNFSVGYYGFKTGLHERAVIGWFAKLGLAFGYNTGGGSGGSDNSFGTNNTTSISADHITTYDVMPDFWMPNTTTGFTIAPNGSSSKIADRFTASVSVTMGWKNIYHDYSKLKYSVLTLISIDEGTAQYQGLPLVLQFGISYQLFRFGNADY